MYGFLVSHIEHVDRTKTLRSAARLVLLAVPLPFVCVDVEHVLTGVDGYATLAVAVVSLVLSGGNDPFPAVVHEVNLELVPAALLVGTDVFAIYSHVPSFPHFAIIAEHHLQEGSLETGRSS